MRYPRLVFSDAAVADILEQSDWFAAKAGKSLANRWERAVTDILLRIAKRPGIGSLCDFEPGPLRGTRRIRIKDFPNHLIFHQLRDGEILVLRVLHGARDLEGLFSGLREGPT